MVHVAGPQVGCQIHAVHKACKKLVAVHCGNWPMGRAACWLPMDLPKVVAMLELQIQILERRDLEVAADQRRLAIAGVAESLSFDVAGS